jgi:hypothetical protein
LIKYLNDSSIWLNKNFELNKSNKAKNLRIPWGSLPLTPTLYTLVTVPSDTAASYSAH